MWNDLKTFGNEFMKQIGFWTIWIVAFLSITYYLGMWSGVCNRIGCSVMLK